MKTKQNLIILIAVIVLLVIGIGINYKFSQSQTEVDDDGNPVANPLTQAAATPPPAPTPAPPAPTAVNAPPSGSATKSSPSPALPTELELGASMPGSKVVAIGYTMDSMTESDPSKAQAVINAFTAWSEKNPQFMAKIVLLDLPKDQLTDPKDQDLPLGLSYNRKSIPSLAINPGEGGFTPKALDAELATLH